MSETPTDKIKEQIIASYCAEINKKIGMSYPEILDQGDLNAVFLELVKTISDFGISGDQAAEIFDAMESHINNQPSRLWIDNIPAPIAGPIAVPFDANDISWAKELLSFRAERYFRSFYREKIKGLDLIAKMEYVSERLSELSLLPLVHGQKFVVPALQYLSDELERKFVRVKQTYEKRRGLGEPAGSQELAETISKKIRDLEAEALAKQQKIDEIVEETARQRGLTIRRLLYLLDSEMPIFKNAITNRARGEFVYLLSGLGGVSANGVKGEKIRQEYSTYSRRITEDDEQWLAKLKEKLNKVPLSKGGTL